MLYCAQVFHRVWKTLCITFDISNYFFELAAFTLWKTSLGRECNMSSYLSEYWSEALPILADMFTEVTYGTYIERIKPLYIKDNILYLHVDSNFHKITIEQKYLKDIAKIIRIVMEEELEVKIISDDNLDKNGNVIDSAPPKIKTSIKSNLVDKYTFESFVSGDSSRLAHASALAVSNEPGQSA